MDASLLSCRSHAIRVGSETLFRPVAAPNRQAEKLLDTQEVAGARPEMGQKPGKHSIKWKFEVMPLRIIFGIFDLQVMLDAVINCAFSFGL